MRKNVNLRFSLEEYRRRFSAVTALMGRDGIQALLVRLPDHICYLTGYEDPHVIMYHCLLVTLQGPVLFVRRYELENVDEYTWLSERYTIEDNELPADAIAAYLQRNALDRTTIGYERGLRKLGLFSGIEEYEALQARLPNANFVAASTLIASVRAIKSEPELTALRHAAAIADAGVNDALAEVRPGQTENDVAAAYYHSAIRRGSEYTSLTPFFLSGPRTRLPHGTWRGRTIEAGDPFLFEVSANYHRYEAPVMRTVSVGKPSDLVRRLAAAELNAIETAQAKVKPGMTGAEAHLIMYDIMEKGGFGGEHYKHPSGYSIGLSLPPSWSETHYITWSGHETRRLAPNMVFHVVPIALISQQVGVGFSAVMRITENGCEALTAGRSLNIL